jgi:hypothetical protein
VKFFSSLELSWAQPKPTMQRCCGPSGVTGGLPRFEARTSESIAALEGMTYTYSLAIRSDGGDLSSLSALTTGVDFRFDVTNVTSISLPSLMCMGPPVPGEAGGLYIGADTTITSVDVPLLQEAAGIALSGGGYSSISFPSLTYLGGLSLRDLPLLAEVNLDGVGHLGGLSLINLPLLEDIDLGGVTQLCSFAASNTGLNAGKRWVLQSMVLPPGPERDAYCSPPPENPACVPPAPGYSWPVCESGGQ